MFDIKFGIIDEIFCKINDEVKEQEIKSEIAKQEQELKDYLLKRETSIELVPRHKAEKNEQNYGLCEVCEQFKTGLSYCQSCKIRYFKENFDK